MRLFLSEILEVVQALCACGRLNSALQLLTPERLQISGLNGQPLILALIKEAFPIKENH